MKLLTKQTIIEYLEQFDPKGYAKSRNYIDGGVAKISTYITHGVITIEECVELIVQKYTIKEAEKFLMELVWKEFFMQVQKSYGNDFITKPVRDEKTGIEKKALLPHDLVEGTTDVERVNSVIQEMKDTGRLHNHKRMWLASWCCHWAKLDWKVCADWTYYHFIDGEFSSNHLSRQRVHSTFANKAYFMNEDNLQKYWPGTNDENLRGSYDQIAERIFSDDRSSSLWKQEDMSGLLITPDASLQHRTKTLLPKTTTVRLLTPWRIDETLLQDSMPTCIVLDESFTKVHPRSIRRLEFIQQYAEKYAVPFVIGSYKEIIHYYLDEDITVHLDERYDPFYVDVQRSLQDTPGVTILPYNRINTNHPKEPVMKFFKYRNKTTPFIKKMIDA